MTDKLLQALDRVAQLEEVLGLTSAFSFRDVLEPKGRWSRTGCEPLLGLLLKRDQVPREAAYAVMYGDRGEASQPDIRILDVYVNFARAALRPHDIKIENIWAVGWRMSAEDKAKLRAMIKQYQAAPQ